MRSFYSAFLSFSLVFLITAHAQTPASYHSGSLATAQPGVQGMLDVSQSKQLLFAFGTSRLTVPYERITDVDTWEKVRHRMGVVPTLAVVMIKRRSRQYFLKLTYKDEADVAQTAVFEVSKDQQGTLATVIRTRMAKKKEECSQPQATCRISCCETAH